MIFPLRPLRRCETKISRKDAKNATLEIVDDSGNSILE
jgi:hypothetical protein